MYNDDERGLKKCFEEKKIIKLKGMDEKITQGKKRGVMNKHVLAELKEKKKTRLSTIGQHGL